VKAEALVFSPVDRLNCSVFPVLSIADRAAREEPNHRAFGVNGTKFELEMPAGRCAPV
jgi:hypothetical protein